MPVNPISHVGRRTKSSSSLGPKRWSGGCSRLALRCITFEVALPAAAAAAHTKLSAASRPTPTMIAAPLPSYRKSAEATLRRFVRLATPTREPGRRDDEGSARETRMHDQHPETADG